jgi:hypothetical protein
VLVIGIFFWLDSNQINEESNTASSDSQDNSIIIEESIIESEIVEESIIEEGTIDESLIEESIVDESITDESDVEESVPEESTEVSEDTSDDEVRFPMGGMDTPEDIKPPKVETHEGFIYYEYYYDPRSKQYERIKLSREWQEYTYEMCLKYNVPYEIILGLMGAETGWDVNIGVSDNGIYYGIGMVHMEYNKSNCREYGFELCSPAGGVEAVCLIMSQKLNTFEDIDKALIAYNRGNGGARKLFRKGIYSTAYDRRIHEITNGMLQWYSEEQIEEDVYD